MLSSIWQKLTQNRLFRSIIFGILITITILSVKYLDLFLKTEALSTLEYTLLNYTYSSRDNLKLHDDIRFWNMDESDILQLRWPWSWEKMGHIVNGMRLNGVKVGLIQEDIFSEKRPPSLSEEEALALLEELEEAAQDANAFRTAVKANDVDTDLLLNESIEKWDNLILSQYFLIPEDQSYDKVKERSHEFSEGFLPGKKRAIEKALHHSIPWPHKDNLLKAINNAPLHPSLSDKVGGVGFKRIISDPDGTIRRIPTVVIYNERLYFSQPIVLAAKYFDYPIKDIEVVPGKHLKFKGIKNKDGKDFIIPIDDQGLMILNWTAKDQLTALGQTSFQFIKVYLVREMAKAIVREIEYDTEDINGFHFAFQKLQAEFGKKMKGNGWIAEDRYGHLLVNTALSMGYHNLMMEGAEFDDLHNINQYHKYLLEKDHLTFYNTIRLNLIIASNYEKGDEVPPIEEFFQDEGFSLYPDHFNMLFLENHFGDQFEDWFIDFIAGNELVEIEENYVGDNDELVKFLDWDMPREEFIEKVMAKTGANLQELEKKQVLFLKDVLDQRKMILQDGYKQTLHHIENETIEEVSPLYFYKPVLFRHKDGTDSYTTPLNEYKDKAVFVGLTATGLNALNPTPYTQRYTMAALAPTAFNTILTESFLYEKPEWEPILICIYSILVFLIIFFLPAYISHPLCLAMAAAHGFGVLHLMNSEGLIIAFIFPVLSIMTSHLSGNFYLYWEQLQERKKVRGMFSAMVSPEVLKIMEEDPDKFNLQGEKVEASMFSSDVSGFTSISEGVTAQELALILNLYLTPMSNLVMTYGGYVEKYEGDAIKADFGMPMPDAEHAWKACFSALLQQEELTVVQRMLQIKYGVMITARMGVNTGVVNAGNMGSVNKMQYCAIGEEVAMAEELEPSNKMWETWIAISPETLRLSGDKLKTRMLDVVDYEYVTIPVYELLGWDQEAFLDFWKGKPIPKLVIEGWEKIIPEKILAYINYYNDHKFEGNDFYNLMMQAFTNLEETCIQYVKVSDKLNLNDLEHRYQALIAEVDQMEVKVGFDDLDQVDQKEWQGLEKAVEVAKDEWLLLLNKYLFELKKRTHVVNRMTGKRDQAELDEIHTAIDTLEKNCNCYIKRNRFPTEDDQYGNTFKDHLMEIIPNPDQGLDETRIQQLRVEQSGLEQKVKQEMVTFIEKAKALSEDYHQMMSEHCLVSEDKQKVCDIFGEGRELYLKQEWDKAIEKFDAGLALVADDGPCIKYTERCEDFKKKPPEEGWEGVWEADW